MAIDKEKIRPFAVTPIGDRVLRRFRPGPLMAHEMIAEINRVRLAGQDRGGGSPHHFCRRFEAALPPGNEIC
jgi:hypothetical protein